MNEILGYLKEMVLFLIYCLFPNQNDRVLSKKISSTPQKKSKIVLSGEIMKKSTNRLYMLIFYETPHYNSCKIIQASQRRT